MGICEADYVIAGGGSAGCTLASRLSEDPSVTVVLLEAGGSSDSFKVRMPAGGYTMLGKPDSDWLYMTEPDPSLGGRRIAWSAGRMLGGGSAINGMVYIRGARADYDQWAADGCTGWGWSEVQPYFLKSEGFDGPPGQSHSAFGPLGVALPRERHPLVGAFVEACRERGLRQVEDYCAGDIDGAFASYVTQRNGQRSSAAQAFIYGAGKRPNLTVVTGAMADRVTIEDGRATGVAYRHGGEEQIVRARREVIVTASTMGSPAVLMRSGIGPAAELKRHGIEVRMDAAGVGQNLQEHASVQTTYFVDMPTYNSRLTPLGMAANFLRYLATRRGLMTIAPVEAMAFLRSTPDLVRPDIKLQFGAMAYDMTRRGPRKEPSVVVFANVAKPRSRGEIRLRSADPADKPVIDHKLMGHPDDLAAMIRGVKQVDRIFNAPALAKHVTGWIMPPAQPRDDAEWEALLRANSAIGYHPVGTCAMGSAPTSVTDPRLRVRGVKGLRVVDASILPVMPAANTNAPAIMVGEKGADMIRQDRGA